MNFEELIKDFFGETASSTYKNKMWEDDDKFKVALNVPGVSKDDDLIDIKLKGDLLSVSFKGNSYASAFDIEFEVPRKTKAKDIQTTLKGGILTIEVRKPELKEETIKIE